VKDLTKIRDVILEHLDLTQIMLDYGVEFIYNPLHMDEVQLRCPFHGKDNKPSARLYKATNTCYCWVCQKRWNGIDFIKEKEGFSYGAALSYIIKKFNIDISAIPDMPEKADNPKLIESERKLSAPVGLMFDQGFEPDAQIVLSDEDRIRSLRRKLKEIRHTLIENGALNVSRFEKFNLIVTAFYMVLFSESQGNKVSDQLTKVENTIVRIG
jgi:hypothetical protein